MPDVRRGAGAVTAWCTPGQHDMSDRDMTLLTWEDMPDGGAIPIYGCPPHVREQGLVPRIASGRRGTPPK
ncbi:hypothetical protein RVR_10558 [Actinacidiphila reveromycinica]|uniref:Uncharacterized protein n=1 Tax=Actinacidiphila reveromycinica TaxID=659352 RepID=A0A7U3VRB9_9ACTN|nr:hypothetical protein [Streptomyces sp. SN-593]BBB00559.1 hypothetical protein RVR_7687 [Streptomyces sp. SN-593]BBB00612.1 hypothetical protein RVR_10558 [Streptomyces sp. SN-593]